MATLISPGVDVKILHEDFYISGSAATVPLIFLATGDFKTQPDGVTPALGTYEHGVLRTVTSIKQAIELYGIPKFYESADGNAHHGDARNEYGLDALVKALEINRRAYVIRANVNLNDDITNIKSVWDAKMEEAAEYLQILVEGTIAQYNAVNGLVPADVGLYKDSVTAAELKNLINTVMDDVFKTYSFSKKAFADAFLNDHTVASNGYAYFKYANGVTGTHLTATETYGASFTIDGTAPFTVTALGSALATVDAVVALLNANTSFNAVATASIYGGVLQIASKTTGPSSSVLVVDGATGAKPLFSNIVTYTGTTETFVGKASGTLNTYNADYGIATGTFGGIGEALAGAADFDVEDAIAVLTDAIIPFSNTKEFKILTSLGHNDATKRAAIVKALQAAVNDPFSNARSEALDYNLAIAPGYPELADELLRLSQDMFEEVFIIGETPFNKPPTGPNSIAEWAVSTGNGGRATSDSIGYWYGHGISSNIDGAEILSSAGTTALRTLIYSDANSEGEWIAPAGATRGGCPHLNDVGYVTGALGEPTTFVRDWLDNGARDDLYEFPKCINPITYIPGRGFLVMGQKTASGISVATDRVAVSRLVKYIKRQLRKSLFSFLFEPNDEITRRNVKAATDNFLSTLIDRRALYDFATICDEQNNTPQTIDSNELYVDIAIKPVKAVEFIYARVRIVRTDANIGTKKNIG